MGSWTGTRAGVGGVGAGCARGAGVRAALAVRAGQLGPADTMSIVGAGNASAAGAVSTSQSSPAGTVGSVGASQARAAGTVGIVRASQSSTAGTMSGVSASASQTSAAGAVSVVSTSAGQSSAAGAMSAMSAGSIVRTTGAAAREEGSLVRLARGTGCTSRRSADVGCPVGRSMGGGRKTSVAVARSTRGPMSACGRSSLWVGAHVAAVVAVRVDARVELVGQVGIMRPIGASGRAVTAVVAGTARGRGVASAVSAMGASDTRASGRAVSTMAASNTSASGRAVSAMNARAGRSTALGIHSQVLAVVAIRVDPGISLVGQVGAMRTISPRGRTLGPTVGTGAADGVVFVVRERRLVSAANNTATGAGRVVSMVASRLRGAGVV